MLLILLDSIRSAEFRCVYRCLRIVILLVIIYGLQKGVVASDYPCGTGWQYSKLSGKCYKFLSVRKTWAAAYKECQAYGSPEARPGETRLPQLLNKDDISSLLTVTEVNREYQWTEGSYSAGKLMWNTTLPVNESLFEVKYPSKFSDGDGIIIRVHVTNVDGQWKNIISLSLSSKKATLGYFCEYRALTCRDPTKGDVDHFNKATMEYQPNRFTINTTVEMACKPGYYRLSSLTQPNKPQVRDLINCTGTAAKDFDPNKFKSQWKVAGHPETCHAVYCDGFNVSINFIKEQPYVIIGKKYDYDHKFHVNCSKGYVSIYDQNKTASYLTCAQSTTKLNFAYWKPGNYQPCRPVRCNKTEMLERSPLNGKLSHAVNRIWHFKFSQYQLNDFNQYDNIVTITCNDGYFFFDRYFSKQIICGVKSDHNPVEGQWMGYQGTFYPTPKLCQAVTCRHQEVIISSNDNVRSFFQVNTNGMLKNISSHDGEDYKYMTEITFTCKDGFLTASAENHLTVKCGPHGEWVPRLTPCQPKTESLITGHRKRFIPKSIDAPAARSVGATAIIILLAFLGLIVGLDLTTVVRDVRICRRNFRQLKRRLGCGKREEI